MFSDTCICKSNQKLYLATEFLEKTHSRVNVESIPVHQYQNYLQCWQAHGVYKKQHIHVLQHQLNSKQRKDLQQDKFQYCTENVSDSILRCVHILTHSRQ